MSNIETFEEAFERILCSEDSLDELEEEFEEVYDKGGLSSISHIYGLNQRVNQFEELFQAYREFYLVKDFREGSKMKDRKLHNLMESYRNYFGPGSNEDWNDGVEIAEILSGTTMSDGPLSRQDFYDIIEGDY